MTPASEDSFEGNLGIVWHQSLLSGKPIPWPLHQKSPMRVTWWQSETKVKGGSTHMWFSWVTCGLVHYPTHPCIVNAQTMSCWFYTGMCLIAAFAHENSLGPCKISSFARDPVPFGLFDCQLESRWEWTCIFTVEGIFFLKPGIRFLCGRLVNIVRKLISSWIDPMVAT